ncbi:MAG TPA: FecR domain-containing protein [Lentimicrobium sp.]|nr:FecR domain-containing protein [Lentimicrobium sp.]
MLLTKLKYKRLIIKLIQGEATALEKQQAEQWISKSPENQRLYEAYKGLLILTSKKEDEFNTDRAWMNLQNRIHAEKYSSSAHVGKKPVRKMTSYLAVAGIAAILVLAIGIFSILQKEPAIKEFSTTASVSGEQLLPDGSSVFLNKNSMVKYPEYFTGNIREISIFGEAFFEVSRNPDKPFIIHASGLDIKVVGTSFNVEAPQGGDIVKVTVNTGKVLVYPTKTLPDDSESAGIHLTAGENATYSHQSGQILKGVNDDLNVLSWKTGVLTFRESRLADVFKALETKYETRFLVENQDVLNLRLTARFENDSLDDVLETLSLIFNVKFENEGQAVKVH